VSLGVLAGLHAIPTYAEKDAEADNDFTIVSYADVVGREVVVEHIAHTTTENKCFVGR
jgi:hypothetical protein